MLNPPFLLTGNKTITVSRRAQGSYVNGRYSEASPTTFTIIGNVQPGLKWNDLQQLPEGERNRKSLRLYTSTPLRTRKEGSNGWDADVIQYTDPLGVTEDYQVVKVTHYAMGVLNHYKAVCIRVEVT